MKIESPAFTLDDVKAFMDTYLDRERTILADRLQAASDRLAALAPRIRFESGSTSGWSAHELLAHLAVLSKFYGVLVHRISTGQPPNIDLLEAVHLRDTVGHQMSQLEPADLLRMAMADHQRTIETLRTGDPKALRRSAELGEGITMTAEEIARLPLVSHLEIHLDQLERLLES
ncbi:MAG: DinB family protein [Chloroflexi bacterium]|nr:MAG: DinB family protein [Chloroflexota bacterium]